MNGKRQRTRCVGGTRVRLFGIDAPELKQKCRHPSGRDFLCGRAAASFLLEYVRGRAVECKGNSVDRYGRLIAVCFVGGKDLNAMMVGEGLQFSWRWNGGTISLNLDVIWGMSAYLLPMRKNCMRSFTTLARRFCKAVEIERREATNRFCMADLAGSPSA